MWPVPALNPYGRARERSFLSGNGRPGRSPPLLFRGALSGRPSPPDWGIAPHRERHQAFTGEDSSASATLTSATVQLNYSNAAGVKDRLSCAWIGGGLSDGQMTALYNRLNTYLTAIGAD